MMWDGMVVIQVIKYIPSVRKNPMSWEFMICPGMFMSGVLTGMLKTIIVTVKATIPVVLLQVRLVCFVAVHGATLRVSAVRRFAAGTGQTTGSNTTVFVLPGEFVILQLFYTLGYRGGHLEKLEMGVANLEVREPVKI